MMPLSIESLDVEITSRCNLNCSYCYLGQGCLNKESIGDMSDEVMEQVFSLIEKHGYPKQTEVKVLEGPRKGQRMRKQATKITFYGGEPLLAFERVKRFVDESRKRGMQLAYSLLSNGTTGTHEQAWWLKKNNIWIQRSIDGCPEAQEAYRPNSIEKYLEKNEVFKDYKQTRRMTIRPEFAKLIPESMAYFEWMGFEYGGSPMPDFYCEWSEEHIKDFVDSLWKLTHEYLKRWKQGKAFYNYFLSREMQCRFSVPMNRTQVGCGGGKGLYCASWDGWLYLCHRFSKEPHDNTTCYGSLKEALDGTAKGFGPDVHKCIERSIKRETPDECKNCVGYFGCEKGCMHNNIKCTGDILKPPKLYCILRQEAAKMVIWLDQQLRTIDPDWWKQNHRGIRGSNGSHRTKTNGTGSNEPGRGQGQLQRSCGKHGNQSDGKC